MSALQSMTGFGSGSADVDDTKITCDIRSVNGKNLDMRVRLPGGMEMLEAQIKKQIAQSISRGNLQISVSIGTAARKEGAFIDRALFKTLAAEAKALAAECGVAAPTADGILALRGVIISDEQPLVPAEGQERDRLCAAILMACEQAISQLLIMREAEGAALKAVLSGHLKEIQKLNDAARGDEANRPEQVHARLKAQIDQFLSAAGSSRIDPQRLANEAALLATKADICEETDRLNAHVKAAEKHIADGGPVGRKLDFLAQEFNREANTICSKSSSSTLTATGLTLKAVIDQFKEQVQNLQ